MAKADLEYLAVKEVELSTELEALRKNREQLELLAKRLERKLQLIREMRALEDPNVSIPTETGMPAAVSQSKATPTDVRESARAILSASPKPLHISEIHRRFKERGFPIPGGGTPFNILAHLVNHKDFVRVARGTYALAGSVPQDQVIQKAPRRRRLSRRRKPFVSASAPKED